MRMSRRFAFQLKYPKRKSYILFVTRSSSYGEQSGRLDRILYEWGSTLQLMLFTLAFIGGIFVWALPPIVNLISFLVGEILIGTAMVWIGSRMMRYGMIRKQLDAAVSAAAEKPGEVPLVPIPPLRAFLVRNTYVYCGVLLAWGMIWGSSFGILFLPLLLARDTSWERTAKLITVLAASPFDDLRAVLSIIALGIVAALVDRYIHKNASILKTYYAPDDDTLIYGISCERCGLCWELRCSTDYW